MVSTQENPLWSQSWVRMYTSSISDYLCDLEKVS